MKRKVIIRQERPQYTRAPFGRRTWELFVQNPLTKKYEYYGFTGTFLEAIVLADIVWARSNQVSPLQLSEATC